MRLAGQLLAVSAVTLLLPWAGCQYMREVESALRDGEQQAIASTAQLLGAALAPLSAEFSSPTERWGPRHPDSLDIYVHALGNQPTLDGFVEDWGTAAAHVEPISGLGLLAGRRGSFVHVFAVAAGSRAPGALQVTGHEVLLEFPLEAPGPATAVIRGAAEDPRARGYWQATSQGWQIEARIPATMLGGRLGVRLLNADGTLRGGSFAEVPGWMTGPAPAAQAALDALGPPGQRLYVTDRAGFILAARGADRGEEFDPETSWMEQLYRRVLGERLEAEAMPPTRPGQLGGGHVELAAQGVSHASRFTLSAGGLLAAAAPIGGDAEPAAIIVLERDTAEILSLTREPTRRLLSMSLLASLGAAGVLLGFAIVLSFRIRRLRDAAAAAVGRRGEIAPQLPGAGAGDELGDLARSFGGLLGRVRDHNLYLQGLGGRLAHELRTPLAVVRTSLDNLEAERAVDGPWLARARGGIDRMGALVNALSAAQRIERAVDSAEHELFDFAAQVSEMVEAYRALHPLRNFVFDRPGHPCLVQGAPDLVAQALDKLVENAVDFAPPSASISIELSAAESHWRLSVANPGSHLPPGPPERLFDSLVSERNVGTDSHLGLGLFIVRLVAQHHRGRAAARDLPNEGGVEFVIELPQAGTPQGRSGGHAGGIRT